MNRTMRSFAQFEPLETRQLMAHASLAAFASYRSIDGTGNNLAHRLWGSAGIELLRQAVAHDAHGMSDPADSDRPIAREISNTIVEQTTEERIPDDRFMSAMIYAWGQFIDHDIDLTPNGTAGEKFNVLVPEDADDPFST